MSSGASNQTGSQTQTDATGSATSSDQEALDQLCDLLAHPRRRAVLACLAHHQTPIALADLADEVAVQEHDTRLPAIPAETVKRTYLSLYHTHVPKLEAAELVTYNQDQDQVVPINDVTAGESILNVCQPTESD